MAFLVKISTPTVSSGISCLLTRWLQAKCMFGSQMQSVCCWHFISLIWGYIASMVLMFLATSIMEFIIAYCHQSFWGEQSQNTFRCLVNLCYHFLPKLCRTQRPVFLLRCQRYFLLRCPCQRYFFTNLCLFTNLEACLAGLAWPGLFFVYNLEFFQGDILTSTNLIVIVIWQWFTTLFLFFSSSHFN